MSHTVITTTTTTVRSGDSVLNTGYLGTIPGMLKIGQTLSLLIAFLCVYCVHGWPSWHAFCFFEVVALWFLLAFLIFLLMHLFRLQGKMPCINWPLTIKNLHQLASYSKSRMKNCNNWPLTEFFHYSVGCVLLFIASIIASVKSGGVSALVAGSVFGFIATFLMAVNLWTSYSMACGPQAGASV
uniref:MARVEL domain-containing protein n=1 Tax=Amphiprion ocellaris TaxID=80972 RepID=A0AAQ5XW21_AMPOC